jgi:hypothetical protein
MSETTAETIIAEKLSTAIYTSAEGFVGKIVTIRNAESTDTVITGRVTEAKLSESADGVLHVSEIRIANAGNYDLWTPFKDTPYASKKWYWSVEDIA